jgi:hypothetical protein
MEDFLKRIPTLTFWIAFVISVINIIATIIGANVVLQRITSSSITPVISITLAVIIMSFLVLSWINSLMSNHSGKLIYLINLFISPFGYHNIGLPYWLGITLAFAPYFLYFGVVSFFESINTFLKKIRKNDA